MIGFLNIQKASEYLGRSPRWLRGHIHEIPHYRPGGQILFDVADLKAWMTRFRVEPKDIDISGLVNRVIGPRRQQAPR